MLIVSFRIQKRSTMDLLKIMDALVKSTQDEGLKKVLTEKYMQRIAETQFERE